MKNNEFFNTEYVEFLYCLTDALREENIKLNEKYYYNNGEMNLFEVCRYANDIAKMLLEDVKETFSFDCLIEAIANVMIANRKIELGIIKKYLITDDEWEIEIIE